MIISSLKIIRYVGIGFRLEAYKRNDDFGSQTVDPIKWTLNIPKYMVFRYINTDTKVTDNPYINNAMSFMSSFYNIQTKIIILVCINLMMIALKSHEY